MCKLIPIQYNRKKYPINVKCEIDEIAGNFDSKQISSKRQYSVHTEYSFAQRKLTNILLMDLDEIKKSIVNGVPQLWTNEQWAKEFSEFIIRIVGNNIPPKIIEIHPPFKDYCPDFAKFFNIYKVFENEIKKVFPTTKIFIENRCGNIAGKKFLLCDCQSVLNFLDLLTKQDLSLKMVLDYPQLFSGENISLDNMKLDKILLFNDSLQNYKHLIGGFHIWGKRKTKQWVSHVGDLNTFFSGNENLKRDFLKSVFNTFNDGITRYFVPEVNSAEQDLHSIIADFIRAGFIFV